MKTRLINRDTIKFKICVTGRCNCIIDKRMMSSATVKRSGKQCDDRVKGSLLAVKAASHRHCPPFYYYLARMKQLLSSILYKSATYCVSVAVWMYKTFFRMLDIISPHTPNRKIEMVSFSTIFVQFYAAIKNMIFLLLIINYGQNVTRLPYTDK